MSSSMSEAGGTRPGPFAQASKPTVQLTVTNSTGNTLHFRIKTTAPKLYAARPGVGKIRKLESVVVYITLHGLTEEPPASFKCKDKFLIHAFTVTSDQDRINGKELWDLAYKDASDIHVHQRKLRVVYLPPGAPAQAERGEGVEKAPSIHVERPQEDDSENLTVDRSLIDPRSSSESNQNTSSPRVQEVEAVTESTVQRKRSLDVTNETIASKSLKLDELVALEEKTITITEVVVPKDLASPVPIYEQGIPVWIVCILVSTTFVFTYIFL
ncbi:unnamed protein product [Cyclocybe aegerita]|uniref:MSP domain-containing protein n=1 Tax=Cyclocybe aegerita TaxID=1973307 RepID=A0A8S0Y0U2_CYCAE|nr:unnamed protein product [Cyclocybe aegerita]